MNSKEIQIMELLRDKIELFKYGDPTKYKGKQLHSLDEDDKQVFMIYESLLNNNLNVHYIQSYS